eukprot:933110-Pyramimonas_sp.AAC.1
MCNAALEPASEQTCESAVADASLPCPEMGEKLQGWSTCSSPCGGGTQTRLRECIEGTTIGVPFRIPGNTCSFEDTGFELVQISEFGYLEKRACNTQVCSEYHYSWGEWGRCSATCGGGVKAREVFCQLSADHSVVDVSFCAGQEEPTSYLTCNTGACHRSPFSWMASAWGACNATCGGGVAFRDVACQTANGTADPSKEACSNLPKEYVPTWT